MADEPMFFVPMIAYQLRPILKVEWLSPNHRKSKEFQETISKTMDVMKTLGLWIAITLFHRQSSPLAIVQLNQLISKTYEKENVFLVHIFIFKLLPLSNFGAAFSLRFFFTVQRYFRLVSRALRPLVNLWFFEILNWIWPKRYAISRLLGRIVFKICLRILERLLVIYMLNRLSMVVRGYLLFENSYWSPPTGLEMSFITIDVFQSLLGSWRSSRNPWARTQPEVTTLAPLNPFKYSSIQGKDTIRLLLIYPRHPSGPVKCALFQTPLFSVPRYEAISYRWGGNGPNIEISVNGHSVMVTPNAFEVLKNRSSFWRPKLVWIDSVCIDQSNEDEKAQQIELMEEIYRKAYIVSATLVVDPGMLDFKKELRTLWGDWAAGLWSDMATSPSVIEYQDEVIKHLTVSLAADLLDDLHLSYFQNQSNHFSWLRKFAPQRYSLRVKAFRQLLANPWFERMWLVQGVALPSSLRIIYGDLEIDWAHLVNAISIINENGMLGGPLLESGDYVGSRVAPPAGCSTITLMALIRQSVQDDQGLPLGELLLRCRQFTATEPKDKLFAIRGMCTKLPEALLKPSESTKKTWEEVYINAAECLVAEGDAARMLVSCGSITERDTQPLETLPSWVPNWSNRQARSPLSFWHEEKGYKAGGPHVVQARVEARSLLLDGIPFDDIMELGPVWNVLPFSTSPWRASELFADLPALFKASYDLIMWSAWTKEPYPGVQGQRVRDAFWRTMIGNRSFKGDPAPSSLAKQFEIYEKFLADIDKHPERIQNNVEIGVKEQEELVSASDFSLPMTRCWGRRRICVTMKGYIGVVPPDSEIGDKIAVFFGMQTPSALRLVKGSGGIKYRNIGECYVHGLMNGEIFETGIREGEFELI